MNDDTKKQFDEWKVDAEYYYRDQDLLVAIEENNLKDVQFVLTKKFIYYLDWLKKDNSKAREIDNYFTMIGDLLEQKGIDDRLPPQISDVLIDFQMIHDLGSSFAPTIKEIETKIETMNN